MAISSIIGQPFTYDLRAAYQSTLITARSPTGSNPVVYFDIYFDGVYYKTITSTAPARKFAGSDDFEVDIKDAIQEYLTSAVMDIAISGLTSIGGSCASCFVRVRGSSVISGLIVPQGPVPVQRTAYTSPVSGGGITSRVFFVLNMALQHEDISDVITFLGNTPYTVAAPGLGNYDYLPLTKNANIIVALDDYGYAPFYMHTNGSSAGGDNVRLFAVIEGSSTKHYLNGTAYQLIAEDRVFYLPYGPKNLQLMANYGSMPFAGAKRYKVGLEDDQGGMPLVTPWITINRAADNHKRVFFRNYLGHYEAINFMASAETLVTASSIWQKTLDETPPPYKKFRGANRFNVRSNETGVLLGSFDESDIAIITQLAASPDAFLQWKGTYGQPNDLLPILIADGEMEILKSEERYRYDVVLKYSYANPNIHTRN